MIDAVDEERKTNDIGEQDEFLADVATDLADFCQELDSCHPLVCAETGLASKVVDVGDESLEQVFHARVFALRIDHVYILGNIVDCEVLQWRDVDF